MACRHSDLLLHEAGTKSPTDNAWGFLYGKKMLAGSAEATVDTRYDAEGRILLSEGALLSGEVPNCLCFYDTSMARPSHATLRKSASQAGSAAQRVCLQTPPGEAEGKDRFKREIGKALQVRPADASSGGEQFNIPAGKRPGFSGLHGNGEAASIVRPGRRERFAALHE